MSMTSDERTRHRKRATDSYLVQTKRLFKSSRTIDDSKKMIEFLELKEELSLANNNLTYLRDDIWTYLGNLRVLNLSDNFLSTLPSVISLLIHLEDLDLSKNRLSTTPDVILTFRSLKKLSLRDNLLTELPDLEVLEHLEQLDVSKNSLVSLPASLASLTRLKQLDLSFNHFRALPICVQQGLSNLEYLDVSGNIRLSLNTPVKSHKLKWFFAKEIAFCPAFPKWILSGQFSGFEELNFNKSKFDRFMLPQVSQKTMIRKLSLQSCSLSGFNLQRILANVIGLRILEIGNDNCRSLHKLCNVFNQCPLKHVRNPVELEELEMRNLDLPFVPKGIGKFKGLKRIDLGGNDLSWLSKEFCGLDKLETLIVDRNSLVEFPQDIGKLRNLKELRASENHLGSLPGSFGELKSLEILDLYDNNFSELPPALGECVALKELDFERNYADTENFVVNNIPCEILRGHLRDKVNGDRLDGPKKEITVSSPESCQSGYESENSYGTSRNVSNTSFVQQNWDESEDSSEEFDPYNPQPPRVKTTFVYLSHKKFMFCPNDIHPPSMRERILLARANGDYQPLSPPVEGQFDDA
ncbi:leucine-rich repeat-containing protein 7 [Diachasma alloeum]|uniref:leucine-rich repeat-containing protein 7 n=1 Tax=Diachasma alloeum TaxID=454923 RepID=UPI00073837F4|nr:leucine-rich repeat-containing protein 7 [Diachasma alloeum]